MKIKLDENLPFRISSILEAAGHDVDTVVDEGLVGADDPTVSTTATSAGRLVLTMDRGFGDIRRYPPGTHAGILVLRIDDQAVPAVARAVEELVDAVELEALSGCVAVFRDGEPRVRRSS